MVVVDGGGFNLEDDIGVKISGYCKEYDNDCDGRDEYGKWDWNVCIVNSFVVYKSLFKWLKVCLWKKIIMFL